MDSLVRVANALMTAILVLIAAFGALVAIASDNGLPLLVALGIVALGARVLR